MDASRFPVNNHITIIVRLTLQMQGYMFPLSPSVNFFPVGQQELQCHRPSQRGGGEVTEQIADVLHADLVAVQRPARIPAKTERHRIMLKKTIGV